MSNLKLSVKRSCSWQEAKDKMKANAVDLLNRLLFLISFGLLRGVVRIELLPARLEARLRGDDPCGSHR